MSNGNVKHFKIFTFIKMEVPICVLKCNIADKSTLQFILHK